MRWRKLGIIYKPDGSSDWARTHAMCATPLIISDRAIRIYLTCRDKDGVGRIGFIDVSTHDPTCLLKIGSEPLLDVGRAGAFDDNGVVASSALHTPDGRVFLYYVGYELGVHVRNRALTGLAVSNDGLSFTRVRDTPVLERSPKEMYFRASPYVRYEPERYRMWYCAGNEWTDVGGKQAPVYELRYLESPDGINWPTQGQVVLPITEDDEHGFSRPWVVPTESGWELYYSVRRRSVGAYRAGFAVSPDSATWYRCDSQLGLDVSDEPWESHAVCYATPVSVAGHTWLFYNGNNFGETGLGLAVREQ